MKLPNLRTITPRKLIGTLVLAVALTAGVFGTAKASEAFFLGNNRNLIFDGVIGSVGDSSLEVFTTSTNPILLRVNNRTVVTGGGGISSLDPGDNVKIVAKRTGNQLLAQTISPAGAGSGYGTAGDAVLVSRGRVVFKSSSTFVVRLDGGVDVTFHVNGSTRFLGTSLARLDPGDRVVVFGTDTGSSSTGFVAQLVFGNRH